MQSARADAISALFVLLHLLKSQAKSIAELLLAHCQPNATRAYAAADMLISWILLFFCHVISLALSPPIQCLKHQ